MYLQIASDNDDDDDDEDEDEDEDDDDDYDNTYLWILLDTFLLLRHNPTTAATK